MKKLKTTKGITLIALIITIIVLLILAGVSINMVIGENGLINKAKSAVDTYQNSATEEQVFLNEIENYIAGGLANIDSIGGGGTPTSANSTINGEAWSSTNPIIPANFKAKNDGAAWDAAGGPEVTKGLVITDDTNEFVWIPVADINSMVMCQTHGASKTLTVNETTGEVTCPTCSASSTDTKLAGKLYSFSGTTAKVSPTTYTVNSGLREPDNLTDSSYADSRSQFTDVSLKTTWDNTTYQTEFNKMVKSVAKYKGFYVGRYETSMSGSTAQSKAGVTPMNSINWFRMYENSKTMAASYTSLESCMIWGCQWDAMMNFILKNPTDASHVTANNNVSHNFSWNYATGSKPADKASNIYDLEGNVKEWTQEADGASCRVGRGGYYQGIYNHLPSSRGSDETTYSNVSIGSRAALYIV